VAEQQQQSKSIAEWKPIAIKHRKRSKMRWKVVADEDLKLMEICHFKRG
jgi:hypothetical protein